MAVSIPLSLVSPTVFIGLYRLGLTESDPKTAATITFSAASNDIVKAAVWAMAKFRRDHP